MYPENWKALKVFDAIRTQWRAGAAGLIGLDYNVLPLIEDRLGVRKKERKDIFYALRIMESEALAIVSRGNNVR